MAKKTKQQEDAANAKLEEKKTLSQQRWQAVGEGYVGAVEVQDSTLYNRLGIYSPFQSSLNNEENFWLA